VVVKVGLDVPDAEYRAKVRKLGLRTAAVLQADLEEWLAEDSIPVYDYHAASRYRGR
jgi:hypothetical protein